MRGDDEGLGPSIPGEGEVRKPALAMELKCDSGFGWEVFRKEICSGGPLRIEPEVAGRGFEIATGSLPVCIDPAMNAPPYLAPAGKRRRG